VQKRAVQSCAKIFARLFLNSSVQKLCKDRETQRECRRFSSGRTMGGSSKRRHSQHKSESIFKKSIFKKGRGGKSNRRGSPKSHWLFKETVEEMTAVEDTAGQVDSSGRTVQVQLTIHQGQLAPPRMIGEDSPGAALGSNSGPDPTVSSTRGQLTISRGQLGAALPENPSCSCGCTPGRYDKKPPKRRCMHVTPKVAKDTDCALCKHPDDRSHHNSHHLGCVRSSFFGKSHDAIALERDNKKARNNINRPLSTKDSTGTQPYSFFRPRAPPAAPPTAAIAAPPAALSSATAPGLVSRVCSAAAAVGASDFVFSESCGDDDY
jgi:hypothetical protein